MAKLKIVQMYGDKKNRGDYDNGIWQHLLNIPFIEREADLEPYDVIINTLWLEATISGRNKRIRERWPQKIIIGLSDHPLSTHISKMPPDQQIAYIKDLSFLDGLMALTEEEKQWYAYAAPNVPVMKVGLPFPFQTYDEKYLHLKSQEKQYIGLGVGASDNDRNFISSALAYDGLRMSRESEPLDGLFLSLPSYQVAPTSQYAEYFGNIWLHDRTNMEEFYRRLNQCQFVFNMADRNTPGRIQGEGAYFGVPIIGSNRLELQNELWPRLAVSPYAVDDAVQLGKKLLEDHDFYYDVTKYAKKQLATYNYRRSKSRFNKMLDAVLAKRAV